jgi:hypothetical protein
MTLKGKGREIERISVRIMLMTRKIKLNGGERVKAAVVEPIKRRSTMMLKAGSWS